MWQALKGGVREKVELATMFGISYPEGKWDIRGDPAYAMDACEGSLKRPLDPTIGTSIPIGRVEFLAHLAQIVVYKVPNLVLCVNFCLGCLLVAQIDF